METYLIRPTDMSPAELFEDSHRRLGLRNRISNALMAIALFAVKSKSPNLSKYIVDGLNLSKECLSVLDEVAQTGSTYQYRDYISKVLLDILTSRLMMQEPSQSKLQKYRKGFSTAQEVFEGIQQKKDPDPEKVREAKEVIKEIDREIESIYGSEESLYRGSFIPR